jgi:DNA ligase-associated metallophosphoesterase
VTLPLLSLAGAALHPDPSGALYWPAEQTLIVADLHLEKGSCHARRGIFLPPYDSRATLLKLGRLCACYRPARVIALGDSFHDPEGPARLGEADATILRALTLAHEFVWIAGNHDGLSGGILGGIATEAFRLGPLVFRHIPQLRDAAGEVAGHLHPCARIATRARSFRRPCFASDGVRCILPAFGAFTGGLDLDDPAFDGLFGPSLTAFLLGQRTVHAFPQRRKAAAAARPLTSANAIAPRP